MVPTDTPNRKKMLLKVSKSLLTSLLFTVVFLSTSFRSAAQVQILNITLDENNSQTEWGRVMNRPGYGVTGGTRTWLSLQVDDDGGGYQDLRSYLELDLSGLPANASIISASLKLTYYSHTIGVSNDVIIERVTSAWSEGDLLGGSNAAIPTASNQNAIVLNDVAWPNTANYEDVNFDVTALVKDMLREADNPTDFHSLVFRLQDEVTIGTDIRFYSNHASSGQHQVKPVLTVEYEMPTPVTWDIGTAFNVTHTPGNVISTANETNRSSIVSSDYLAIGADGNVEAEITANMGNDVFFGLSERGTSNTLKPHYGWIEYAIRFSGGIVEIMESGTQIGMSHGNRAIGDKWSVERSGTTIYYKHNGVTVYQTDNVDAQKELVVDINLYSTYSELHNINVNGFTSHIVTKEGDESAGEDVNWNNAYLLRTTVDGDDLVVGSDAVYNNNGAISSDYLEANIDGWVSFDIDETSATGAFIVGLSERGSNSISPSYNYIDYGMQLENNLIKVVELGVIKSNGIYSSGDILKIERNNAEILYKRNGYVFYRTTDIDVTEELVADVSIHYANSTVGGIKKSTSFTNVVLNVEGDESTGIDINWNPAYLANANINGDDIVVDNDGTLNENGAISLDYLEANASGWVSFKVDETNANGVFVIGLTENTAANLGPNYEGIDNALHVEMSTIKVYEAGMFVSSVGHFDVGDILKVERHGAEILYKRNGYVLHRTESVDPSKELLVKVSILNANSTVGGIKRSPSFSELLNPVTWNPVTMTNVIDVEEDGIQKLKKNTGDHSLWNGGAISLDYLPANTEGWIEFDYVTPGQVYLGLTLGSSFDYQDLEYYVFLKGTKIYPKQGNTNFGEIDSDNQLGDTYRLHRKIGPTEGTIELYRKRAGTSTLIYTFLNVSNSDVFRADVRIRSMDHSANNTRISSSFSLDALPEQSCVMPVEIGRDASWDISRFVNAVYDPAQKSISKTAGSTGTYDVVVSSEDLLAPYTDGWVEYTVSQGSSINRYSYFGLGLKNTTNGWKEVRYAITNNFTASIYKASASQGNYVRMEAGDIFRVERCGTDMLFLRNGHVFKKLEDIDNSEELFVDLALNKLGAIYSNIQVSESFLSPVEELGEAVPIQWNPIYTQCAQVNGDLIQRIGAGNQASIKTYNTLVPNTDGWIRINTDPNEYHNGMIGFSPNTNPIFTSMDYYIKYGGNTLNVYTNSNLLATTTYENGDKVLIQRKGNEYITYLNGYEIHRTSADNTKSLTGMAAFYYAENTEVEVFEVSFDGITETHSQEGGLTYSLVGDLVEWVPTSVIGATVSTGSITSTSTEGGWSSMAFTTQSLDANDNGFMSVDGIPKSGYYSFGLGGTSTSLDPNPDLKYGFYINNNVAHLSFDGSGVKWSNRIKYHLGCSEYRVERRGNKIYWKVDGYVVHELEVDPTEELRGKTYFKSEGRTLDNITFYNMGKTSPVVWHPFSLVRTEIVNSPEGEQLKMTDQEESYGGAYSIQQLPASSDGSAQFSITELGAKSIGLAIVDPDGISARNILTTVSEIDYRFEIDMAGQLTCHRGATNLSIIPIQLAIGDQLKIEREGTVMRYYHQSNGGAFSEITSSTGIDKTETLLIDATLLEVGAEWDQSVVVTSFVNKPVTYVDAQPVKQRVDWNSASFLNVDFDENTYSFTKKMNVGSGWNSSAVTEDFLAPNTDGFIETTIPATVTDNVVVLALVSSQNKQMMRDYLTSIVSVYLKKIGLRSIGGGQPLYGYCKPGDIIRIGRKSGKVYLAKNGIVFKEFPDDYSALQLHGAIKLHGEGDQITELYGSSSFTDHQTEQGDQSMTLGIPVVWDGRKNHCVNVGQNYLTAEDNTGDVGIMSYHKLEANENGWVELTTEEGTFHQFALCRATNDSDFAQMYRIRDSKIFHHSDNYSFYLSYIYGDVLRIERYGDKVLFKRNGYTVYEVTVDPSEELYVVALPNATLNHPTLTYSPSFDGPALSHHYDDSHSGALPTWDPTLTTGITENNGVLTMNSDYAGTSTIEKLQANEDGWTEVQNIPSGRLNLGLALVNTAHNVSDITYRIFLDDGLAEVYNNNTLLSSWSYGCDDKFRVERRGDKILYKKNDYILEKVTVSPTEELIGDFYFQTTGMVIDGNITFYNMGKTRPVVWHPFSLVRTEIVNSPEGEQLKMTDQEESHGGAYSQHYLPSGVDGWVEFATKDLTSDYFIGLNEKDVDANDTDNDRFIQNEIAYYFKKQDNAYAIYQLTTELQGDASIAIDAVLKIERQGDVLRWFVDGIEQHSETGVGALDLVVDLSVTELSSITPPVRVSNSFILEDNVDYSGDQTMTSKSVNWDLTTLANVLLQSDNSLEKTSVNGNWDAGALSADYLPAGIDGWMEMKVPTRLQSVSIGLTPDHSDAGLPELSTIKYGMYLTSGLLRVYATTDGTNSTFAGNFGYFDQGDIVRVERYQGEVLFKKNGVVFYKQPDYNPTTKFFVDVALYSGTNPTAHLNPITISESFVSVELEQEELGHDIGVIWQLNGVANITLNLENAIEKTGTENISISTSEQLLENTDGWLTVVVGEEAIGTVGFDLNQSIMSSAELDYSIVISDKVAEFFVTGTLYSKVPAIKGDELMIKREGSTIQFIKNGYALNTYSGSSAPALYPIEFFASSEEGALGFVKSSFSKGIQTTVSDLGYAILKTKLDFTYFELTDNNLRFYFRDRHFPDQISYSIYNYKREDVLSGNIIRTVNNQYTIDVSSLLSGTYILDVVEADGTHNKLRLKK